MSEEAQEKPVEAIFSSQGLSYQPTRPKREEGIPQEPKKANVFKRVERGGGGRKEERGTKSRYV